jgi:hypothetical protein
VARAAALLSLAAAAAAAAQCGDVVRAGGARGGGGAAGGATSGRARPSAAGWPAWTVSPRDAAASARRRAERRAIAAVCRPPLAT